jgi:ATP-dependent DNA helicase RecG
VKSPTLQELAIWLKEPEGEHIEFKQAKTTYDFTKLWQYCTALANEGGGKMILGVSDKRPRHVLGTSAFPAPQQVVSDLVDRMRLRVRAEELQHPDGRVVIFDVPSRPLGMPLR